MGSINWTWLAKHVILMTIVLALNFTQFAGLPILSTTSQSGRFLAETKNASDDTVRADPLDNLKKYRGGYNVTNKHYWSSTVFTGVPGYAIAILWFLCGLGYGVFLLVTIICRKSSRRKLKNRSHCNKQCYLRPLLLLATFFTLLAITASGLALGGNAKFNSRAKMAIEVIINTADEATDTMYSTTGAMKDMTTRMKEAGASSDATDFLNSTSQRLNNQASEIEAHASKNKHLAHKGLRILYAVTALTISLTLIVVIALLAFGFLKFQRTLQVLILICWIFTVLTWLFFGLYFFVQNFAGDTCTALEGFQQNPYNNSLSSILPCEDLLSARSVLTNVSAGIYNLVNKVNQNISTSYGNFVQICNPFSSPPAYEYQPWNCPATSVRIGDIPRLLRLLACPDFGDNACIGGLLVPSGYFKTVEAYSFSIQKLLDVYPGMESLVECQTIKVAFSEILYKHCQPLKRYMRLLWGALVFLSLVLVVLVITWIIGAHHQQNYHSSGCTVKPDCADMPECGTTNPTNNDSQPRPN